MNAIEVKNLTKELLINQGQHNTLKQSLIHGFWGKKERLKVVNNVSFQIPQGEFVGIIGDNGSGKSTLLKLLAGIYPATDGRITINGRLSPFLELGVGFQPELTAWENIFLYGSLIGMTHQEISSRIDDIISFSELKNFVDTPLKKFSSGMQVRLAFSVAIQADFDILLLDEVLAVGDYGFQHKCLQKFQDFKAQQKTVILVSHDINTIQRHCHRVFWMDNGKIVNSGLPKEICSEYIRKSAGDIVRLTEKRKDIKNVGPRITQIKTLDESGNSRKRFRTGEVINVRVYNQFSDAKIESVFGITIKDVSGKRLFVTNTDLKRIETKNHATGKIVINYEIKQRFSTGRYFITPAIADAKTREFYDNLENEINFTVINPDFNSSGSCDFQHKISISRTE